MESKWNKKIISEAQLNELVARGILYKNSEESYHPLIDKGRWGDLYMPWVMVPDVANRIIELTETDSNLIWKTRQKHGLWFIGPWMLEENYAELIKHGKFRPEPYAMGRNGERLYTLKIMDLMHLEALVNKGVLTKERLGDTYFYGSNIHDMGEFRMPKRMAEQICGKLIRCRGNGSSWYEIDTSYQWNIAPWMLADNYDYLLDRLKGEMNTTQYEPEEEEEEGEEEETSDYNEVIIVGTITSINPEYITVECSTMTDPVLCFGDAGSHCKDDHVKVHGSLRRVHNMMGYPEIGIAYIEEA